MPYRIEATKRAEQDLTKLEKSNRAAAVQVTAAIMGLAENPRPDGVKKLSAKGDLYRIRSGDYRILYQLYDEEILVLLVKIGDRRDVYRFLKRTS